MNSRHSLNKNKTPNSSMLLVVCLSSQGQSESSPGRGFCGRPRPPARTHTRTGSGVREEGTTPGVSALGVIRRAHSQGHVSLERRREPSTEPGTRGRAPAGRNLQVRYPPSRSHTHFPPPPGKPLLCHLCSVTCTVLLHRGDAERCTAVPSSRILRTREEGTGPPPGVPAAGL